MGKVAFLFPGQGSQSVGMGKDVDSDCFARADHVLDYSLSTIMYEGPEEELKKTEHTQPALVTMSVALLQIMQEEGLTADFVAGHSLGEYSALVAAGAMRFEDAVYAVRQRGLFMEEAVPNGEGAMAAVLGLERATLETICTRAEEHKGIVELANLNCPGQIVISGSAAGVKEASRLAKEEGARRVLPLQVSGPFHSSLMKPAAKKLATVLEKLEIEDANISVIANVSATAVNDASAIRENLIQQVYSPVLWEDTIHTLLDNGVDTFVEIGSGNVLTGLVRKINRKVKAISVQSKEDVMKVKEQLEGVSE
ncbi:ACP S-malonyltransferase [Halalkalibacter hemicellulosilyticus]|uniref:Malonyl CoA-acyl carrier protein transacylase n=1 Tax=Halalkalibacter hemicellulosilyticusJCM 9152 TaxID=1236971 RepID=W4QB62_9BACI|nr:ACP S-malonyltransferase [Halalkalibacter hemicellulosilyticus]GAE29207.1 malonyl CoA-acyl carrier protein transacylase [Halalkalibacter hemicellulosilyticusJCM 9152]